MRKFSRDKIIFFGGALAVFLVVQVLISLDMLNDFWNTIIRIGGVMPLSAWA